MSNNELYSYHVFLFPFQWAYTGKGYERKTIEEKNNLTHFCGCLEHGDWKRNKLSLDSKLAYNEYNFFYDFVREILYDKDFSNRSAVNKQKTGENFIAHYEYDVEPETTTYSFEVPGEKHYSLLVESIILHLYNTGVGVLSFHLNNRDKNQSAPDDILKINQYGRRIYPPFLSMPPEVIGSQEQYQPGGFREGLEGVQQAELASNMTIGDMPPDNFVEYATATDFNDGVFKLPVFIKRLFRDVPVITSQTEANPSQTEILLSPVLDDRMFVVCWYGSDECAERLKKVETQSDHSIQYEYQHDDWWYKFVSVDGQMKTCQNDEMAKNLILTLTYDRWLNFGTLYGASRYSFVCLTESLPQLRGHNAAYIVNHMQTMYYKMVELCLVQRACIMRFSDEVAEISAMKPSESKWLAPKVSSLYKQYIRFVNKIYFREVTAQEQGIELYDLIQDKMNLAKQVADLDSEIGELHDYLQMEEQTEQNRDMTRLTIIAGVFLPPTLVAGILGMNDLLDTFTSLQAFHLNVIMIVGSIVIGLLIAYQRRIANFFQSN